METFDIVAIAVASPAYLWILFCVYVWITGCPHCKEKRDIELMGDFGKSFQR